MSADRVHQELIRWTTTRQWPGALVEQWRLILEGARPGALELLSAISYLTHGEDKAKARSRAAVCGMLFALANLIDDLQDREATYIQDERQSPALQALGWSLFAQELLALGLGEEVNRRVWRLAEKACVGQVTEVGTTVWSASLYKDVTQRIAGDQWALYLRILWQGTEWEERADMTGRALGSIASLEIDRREGATRYVSMSEEDQAMVLSWRSELMEQVKSAQQMPGIKFMMRWLLQDESFGQG